MFNSRSLRLVFLIGSLCWPASAGAQSLVIDSLRDILIRTDLSPEERVMTMGQLARVLFERDLKEAIRTGKEARRLSWSVKDEGGSAFAHATLGYLYVQQDSLILAREAIDSALVYAGHTGNKTIQGYVRFRRGWLEFIQEDTEQAVGSFLKALDFLENENNRQAFSYQSHIYHYLSSIYAYGNDPSRQEKYARLSLQAAMKSRYPDDLCDAWLSIGNNFVYQFREDTTRRDLLDSALSYNRKALVFTQRQRARLIYSNPAAVALNTANLYFQHYPPAYRDSAEKYINIALPIAQQIKHTEIIANCYGILSEYAIMDGDYEKAEKILLMAMGEIEGAPDGSSLVKARMTRALATVAEKKGDLPQALAYYKEYIKHDKAAFDTEKLSMAQKLEARYESEKREQELAALEERAAFNRKLNFFYGCLIIAGLLALIFLFRAYHFRLKSSLQRQQLLAREKEEAHLQSQLKSAEAKRLELEKQEALLQASLQTEEAARLQAERQLMQERQERLEKELLAGTLQVEEKNELLQALQEKLNLLDSNDPLFRQINRMLTQHRKMDEDFGDIKAEFREIHPEFFTRLQQKAGNSLTRLDLKYCSYMLIGLSNKEIASRMNIDPKSIRMARYRLKQKLTLQKDEGLDEFISSLGNDQPETS